MLGDQLIDQEELKRKHEKLFEQQKKFKNLQTDKKMFAEETVNLIKKQKMAIDKLRKENQSLKELIAKVNNDKAQDQNHHLNGEELKELLNEISRAIQDERETQKNIDMHICNFQKKIVEKKKNCVGTTTGAESEGNMQKQIKILQNRLDKANQKFNETIAVNKDLKHVIDSLRKERVIFDNLYRKLESELHEKRKKMADIIERANGAYEDRDKANQQITTMKQQAKKEAFQFEKEIKEMSHLMEKIKLTTYTKKVVKPEGLAYNLGYSVYNQEEFPPIEAKTHNRQTKKGSEQIQKIQKFREDFAKIEAATEIDNFDELLRIFSTNEEKNFEMFKFVNLQSNEIEELEFELGKLRDQIGLTTAECDETGKQKYLLDMEAHLKILNNSLSKVDGDYKYAQKEAKVLSGLIERIFDTIECDRELAKEVGGSKHISETNMLVFLAIIEHKASQIVGTYKNLSNDKMLNPTQDKTQALQPNLFTFEDFEDNQEYDKILTADQLKRIANDFVTKQFSQKQKKKEIRLKKK